MEFILGSQSPRRKEILSYFSLPFKQVSSDFDEEALPFGGDPGAYAAALSLGKAQTLAKRFPTALILTADTVVFSNGKLYGKPRDDKEACVFLRELVGRWHTVCTALTLQQGEKRVQQAEYTQVLFNDLTDQQIQHYIARTEWADKAGGYAIQMAGGLIVRKIDGCYYNVMGLPINTLAALLHSFQINLWDYL